MRVTPAKEPAKVIVAPNSPSAREKAKAVEDTSAGIIRGRVTDHSVREGDAPSALATRSSLKPRVRNAPSSDETKKGSDTKVCAMMTASVVKAILIPNICR